MIKQNSMQLPARWAEDPLSFFLDMAFKNVLAAFVQEPASFQMLLRIDQNFLGISDNLKNTPDVLAAILLLRSHSAFRAASRLALSGQASETHPVLRSCLECALYALHIKKNPALGEVWLSRHNDDRSHKKVRNEFAHSAVMKTLLVHDRELHSTIRQLYERTIDLGAHPNERVMSGSLTVKAKEEHLEIEQLYLHGGTLTHEFVLKTTSQVGLGSLCIFGNIFPKRFEDLGIAGNLSALRGEL